MDRAGRPRRAPPAPAPARRTGPAGGRAVGRARPLPAVPVAGRSCASQWHFLRDRRRRRRYLRALRRHARAARGGARTSCVGGIGIFPKVAHAARPMSAEGVDHVHCHFANHPALAGWLIHRLTGHPVQLHGPRLRPPRRPDDAADQGRRGRLRRDDLARQPALIECDLRAGRRRQGRGHPLRRRPDAPSGPPSRTATGRCGSSQSARCMRSRARPTSSRPAGSCGERGVAVHVPVHRRRPGSRRAGRRRSTPPVWPTGSTSPAAMTSDAVADELGSRRRPGRAERADAAAASGRASRSC